MHHSDVDYWRSLQALKAPHPDLPTPRVCRLLERTFQKWREKPCWLDERDVGHLFRGPNSDGREQGWSEKPIIIRKARAIEKMLEIICLPDVAARAGSFQIDPDELIIGTPPPFSVGQGKEFVRYLTVEEELRAMLDYLNELSPMGHIVPDHMRVVQRGLAALINECEARAQEAESAQREFYEATAISMRAVIAFAGRYADHAAVVAKSLGPDDPRHTAMAAAAERLRRVPAQKAESFLDALQSIYIVHCALHWTVEIVPIGRLDQILQPLLTMDLDKGMEIEDAQEALDCFWIKLDERAILDRRHLENRFTAADGVLTGFWGASNFDQGGLLNQWMQQITIGGVLPDDADEPTDACNQVTRLCLEAARRLPLNSPTLDLRVHAGTPDDVLDLAAAALLSGGAHPVLLNDDKIIAGLIEAGESGMSLASARNYACDGCYETMVAGESEFSFGFVSAPDLVEKALNRGASFSGSGPVNLRGLKDSWRSPPAPEIEDWPHFWAILVEHMKLGCHRYLRNLFLNYGNKTPVAPSPLLSCLIGGCLESGRDFTDGGANFHIFSPLLTGISTAADSLYAIRKLVFEERCVAIDELVTALATDWGKRLVQQNGASLPAHGRAVSSERIAEIRGLCESQPKFGFGNKAIDEIAWKLINDFCDAVRKLRSSPVHEEALARLKERYSTGGKLFDIMIAPGVGTFEQYILGGSFLGASADGRSAGTTIASDLSPSPVHRHHEPVPSEGGARHAREGNLAASFASYADSSMSRLGDGAPADYNLPENYPPERLAAKLRDFANGAGGSIATFTVADPETLAGAVERPDEFNLVRVRMGGWTEFFVALFPDHQEQHRRRPLFVE
ncbi:pyruvate formate lyase family protein [Mesorhizobium sp. IMUNJ 23232]|uniref:pyruvate formate lyase family protein n=1 Tax=Mesorhizobium sp. IMUNJ 23232 TaxID=3376064 RepID=UPI003794255A